VVTITLQPGAGDWDLLLYDANGAEIDTSGEPPALPETISFASTGSYTVSAAPFVSNPATPYTGRAEMKVLATVPATTSSAPAPKFLTYAPPGLTEADPTSRATRRAAATSPSASAPASRRSACPGPTT
jgi:hypothetical protein